MTKANLIDYIVANYEEPEGGPVSRQKLESLKKAELESFINERDSIENVEAWLANR